MSEEKFNSWVIAELFGHAKIAGELTEATIAGEGFIRIDVPEVEGIPAFTKFFGKGAIYSITPVSEEVARVAAKRMQAQPIRVYMPELLSAPPRQIESEPDFHDDEYPDEYEDTEVSLEDPLPF